MTSLALRAPPNLIAWGRGNRPMPMDTLLMASAQQEKEFSITWREVGKSDIYWGEGVPVAPFCEALGEEG